MGENAQDILHGCLYCRSPRRAPAPPAPRPNELSPAGNLFSRSVLAPRPRSGLAYAAGFAGLAYLFHVPLSTLIFGLLGPRGWEGLLFVSTLCVTAPVALGLSVAAAATLDRSPETAGRVPAMLGFLIGLLGTIKWLWSMGALLRELPY